MSDPNPWERKVNGRRIEWHEPDDGMGWHGHVWTAEGTILTDSALRSMGLIAYWAAWLESHIETAMEELVFGFHAWRVSKVMTRDLTASQMIDRLRAVVRLDSTPDAQALAILETAKRALVERNRVLHGAMGGHLNHGWASLSSRRKGETSEISDEELRDVAELVFDAAMVVSNFRWHLLRESIQRDDS